MGKLRKHVIFPFREIYQRIIRKIYFTMTILIRVLTEIIFICTFGDGYRVDCDET